MTNRYKLQIAYDGTCYCGWQIQSNARSIQQEIEKALSIVLRTPIKITGSGRTDQGVHAKGQVAHFDLEEKIITTKLLLSLNGLLPLDIRIKNIEEVQENFHSRFSAKSKVYHYHFWTDPVIDPMSYLYRTHMRKPFSKALVKEALECFIGTKDFTTFANLRGHQEVLKSAVRIIKRIDLVDQEGGFRLEFEGNGFLYKMVRNIVGVLIEVGQKRREIQSIASLFDQKNRKAINMPAPAHGLFLHHVIY